VGELLFPIHERTASFSWRPYQIASVQAAQQCLAASSGCLLVLPCGCGKTEIAVRLIQTMAHSRGALVISPLDTLVSQTASRLRLRGVRCGVEKASLKSDELVTVASYKSLISRSRFEKFVGTVSLVIVDESHLNYSKRAIEILTALRDGGAKIVGLTASPDRMTGDPLTEFYGPVPYFYTLQDAINDGWLVPPKVWLTVAGELDLSQFDEGSGDFNANRLAKEMARDANVQTVSQLVLQHHEGEPSVVFCQGIIQAEKVRQVLARGGLEAAIVHSRMEEPERRLNLSMFEDGKLNIVLNVGCLSLGWDAPIVKKVFMCKPTRSRVVYQQAVGRGTRPIVRLDDYGSAVQRRQAIAESSKPFFEIFDLVDASRHNDLVTAVEALQPEMEDLLARRVRKAREGKGPQGLSDLERLVAAEQALMAEEAKQQAREESARAALTERQRAAWLAGVEFSTCERDAFAPAEQRPKVRGWRVTFGKYKGTLLRDVDTGWLHWALAKCHMNPAFRAAVEREVRRRAS
jgi:superfamily II DNA or RNA helicase